MHREKQRGGIVSYPCLPYIGVMAPGPARVIILFNKPYGVLSQFTAGTHAGTHGSLAAFGPFPSDVYPAGRLDADSEGLLLLTNDARIQHLLLEPRYCHPRTYLVQVERVPDAGAIALLESGTIALDGRRVLPASARLLSVEPDLPPRPVPIRYRKNVPTAWLEIILREGKNRQVRRMTAAAGHPALRLFRSAVGSLTCRGLEPGKWRALSPGESARFTEDLERNSTTRR